MSKTLFDVYKRQVFDLAKTLVIKHDDIARAMNQALEEQRIFVFSEETFSVANWESQVYSYLPDQLKHLTSTIIGDFNSVNSTEVITYRYSWKYYRNLAGKYHESDHVKLFNAQYEALYEKYKDDTRLGGTQPERDEYIQDIAAHVYIFVAHDSGVPIPVVFTTDQFFDPVVGDLNLLYEYRFGSVLYNQLIERYPDYVSLINGILVPVPERISVPSPNSVILSAGDYVREYDPLRQSYFYRSNVLIEGRGNRLIEENETNLIEKLNYQINAFMKRWHNSNYLITDDLYMAVIMGILYAQLPMAIFNIRLENCKTQMAHSYHISQYLESHGRLAKYVPSISKNQALWLYRNIEYVEANVGKQETFMDLVTNILDTSTPKIPLAGFDMRHNLANLRTLVLEYEDVEQGIYPDPYLKRIPINFTQTGVGTDERTIAQMVEKEALLSRDGLRNLQEDIARNKEKLTHTKGNRLPTKILESSVVDLSDRLPYTLGSMLLNHWIYKSANSQYDGSIFFTHPVTSERLSVTTKNAFLLFLYVYNKGYANIELTELPQTVNARIIPRLKTFNDVDITPTTLPALPTGQTLPAKPTNLAYFDQVVDRSRVSDELILQMIGNNSIDYSEEMRYSDGFYDHVKTIHKEITERYFLYAGQHDLWVRGQLEAVMQHMYWHDVPCTFDTDNTLYADWLEQAGIDFTGMQQVDYVKLSTELLRNATGTTDTINKTLRDLQTAVISILRQFSSYSVQYIQEIEDSPAYVENWKALRGTDQKNTVESYEQVYIPIANVVDTDVFTEHHITHDLVWENSKLNFRVTEFVKRSSRIGLRTRLLGLNTQNTRRRITIPLVNVIDTEQETVDVGELIDNNVLNGFNYYDPNA